MAAKAYILMSGVLASLLALSACDDSQKSESTTQEKPAASAPAGTATPPPAAQAEKKSAAERAGQGDFDATGKIPCAEAAGQAMQQCDFGVAREGGGTATVIVTTPDGRNRALFFAGGTFLSADISQADGDITASATKEADLFKIQVGEERYEVPEAVITGG